MTSAYKVYAGFRDARRDIQDPPVAQSARASPDPHDEEVMDARPDQEEMEDAINRFLLQMEKQEKKGFLVSPQEMGLFAPFQWPTRSRLYLIRICSGYLDFGEIYPMLFLSLSYTIIIIL